MSEHKHIPHESLTPEELLAWAENRVSKDDKNLADDPFLEEAAEGVRLMDNPAELLGTTHALNQAIRQKAGAGPAAGSSTIRFFSPQGMAAIAASIAVILVVGLLFKNTITSQEMTASKTDNAFKQESPVLADQLDEVTEKDAFRPDSIVQGGQGLEKPKSDAPKKNSKTSQTIKQKDTAAASGLDIKLDSINNQVLFSNIHADNQGVDYKYTSDGDFEADKVDDDDVLVSPVATDPLLADAEKKAKAKELERTEQALKATAQKKAARKQEAADREKAYLAQKTKARNAEEKLDEQEADLVYNYSPDSISSLVVTAKGSSLQVNNYTNQNLTNQQNLVYNKGIAYFNSQNFDKAHQQFNQVLKEQPNNQEVIFQQGLTYLEEGRLRKAQKSFEKMKEQQLLAQGYGNSNASMYKKYDLSYLIKLLKYKDEDAAKAYLKTGIKDPKKQNLYQDEH